MNDYGADSGHQNAEQAPAAAPRPMPHTDIYAGWFGESVKLLTPTTEADPVAILGSLISAFSVMAGPEPRVHILDDEHPVSVWTMILGRTGTGRKGMSVSLARKVLRVADPDFYSKCIASGLSSGEGLITALADEEDFPDRGGKQLLVIETEYAVTMARAGRDGNSLGGVLRQAWDGDNLSLLTRSQTHATRPHVGIIAHITPGEFRARVKNAEMAGGTYNRFLPLFSERIQEIPLGEGAPRETVNSIGSELGGLIKSAKDVQKVGLAPGARTFWSDVVYPSLTANAVQDGPVAQFTARATAYCRRIAAVYALADGRATVDENHMRAAYALVTYSRASAAYVLGAASTGDPHLDKALSALKNAGPNGLTRTQFNNDVFGRVSGSLLSEVLEKLSKRPGVCVEHRKTGGRPRETWFYSPEKAEEAEKAVPPAGTSSGPSPEEGRNKGLAPWPQDLIRTYSGPVADEVPAGHRASSAYSASSGGFSTSMRPTDTGPNRVSAITSLEPDFAVVPDNESPWLDLDDFDDEIGDL